jgi:alpha-1,2-mannosyltransferase
VGRDLRDVHPPSKRDPRIAALRSALIAVLALNLLAIGVLLGAGHDARDTLKHTNAGQWAELFRQNGSDSWDPMSRALLAWRDAPDHDLYAVFFDDHVKFQYPPTALLLLVPLPSSTLTSLFWEAREPTRPDLKTALSLLALALTGWASYAVYLDESGGSPPRSEAGRLKLLGLALTLAYHPLLRSHSLGQVQVFIGALLAISVLAYARGRVGTAGLCVGLCALAKPQYALILLWAMLRREWRFATAVAAAGAAGLALSTAIFGLAPHLRYLDVLSFLSQRGEVFWQNKSVNGLLNRWVDPHGAEFFAPDKFPPYSSLVHLGTLLSSLVMLGVALLVPLRGGLLREPRRARPSLDYALMVVASTIATPIAWEHHYGALLAALAVIVPNVLAWRPFGAYTGHIVGVAYVMCSVTLLPPSVWLHDQATTVLSMHAFWGMLALFGLGCAAARAALGRKLTQVA